MSIKFTRINFWFIPLYLWPYLWLGFSGEVEAESEDDDDDDDDCKKGSVDEVSVLQFKCKI